MNGVAVNLHTFYLHSRKANKGTTVTTATTAARGATRHVTGSTGTTAKGEAPTPFLLHAQEVLVFEETNSLPANPLGRPRLYLPASRTYQGWDAIYDDGEHTAFFQFSMSELEGSTLSKTEKTFEGETLFLCALGCICDLKTAAADWLLLASRMRAAHIHGSHAWGTSSHSAGVKSQNAEILDRLRGVTGHKASLDKQGRGSWQPVVAVFVCVRLHVLAHMCVCACACV